MQRDYLFSSFKIKSKSTFNIDEFYKTLFRWFEAFGYDFHEDQYLQVDEPGGSKQLIIQWSAKKPVDQYIAFVIETNFLITGLTKVEIEKQGVKTQTNKGTMEMRLNCYLLKDYEASWEKFSFFKFLREVYDRFIIRSRLEAYEGELYEEFNKYVDEIKSFLNLHRF